MASRKMVEFTGKDALNEFARLWRRVEVSVCDPLGSVGFSVRGDGSVEVWATERAIRELDQVGGEEAGVVKVSRPRKVYTK